MTKPNFNLDKVKESKRSFPYLGIIFLILFTLKLAQVGVVATLSWWWVTLPLWGPFALCLGIVLGGIVIWLAIACVMAIVAIVSETYKKLKNPK